MFSHGVHLRDPKPINQNPQSAMFGRLFAEASDNTWPDPGKLGAADGPMNQGSQSSAEADNPGILAIFTYLGQFIDHDITLDLTSSLERKTDPRATRNFRTPALELDSLYGAGPELTPHLYESGSKREGYFLVQEKKDRGRKIFDLPRRTDGVALLADPRNDQNLIVSQLHTAFLLFHNKVLEALEKDSVLATSSSGVTLFDKAQTLVRWHYQWIIQNQFLPLIAGRFAADVRNQGRRLYDPHDQIVDAFIPVEFSVAAFRYGHSQIRPEYELNATSGKVPLFATHAEQLDLRGGPVGANRAVEWERFLDPKSGQRSQWINTKIASPMLALPLHVLPADPQLAAQVERSIAVRTLRRSQTFSVPSGHAVVQEANRQGLGIEEIAKDKIWSGDFKQFASCDVPLWFYILREAELHNDGASLGPLGGRIVAEVLNGLLEKDKLSYVAMDPDWKPVLKRMGNRPKGDFDLQDLLHFAGVFPAS